MLVASLRRKHKCRLVLIRYFTKFTCRPECSNYYSIDLQSNILGKPSAQRSKLEGNFRWLADKLFLTEKTNKAILEKDIEEVAKWPNEYINKRDTDIRIASSQFIVKKRARAILIALLNEQDNLRSDLDHAIENAQSEDIKSKKLEAYNESRKKLQNRAICSIAKFYKRNSVVRLSTNLFIMRSLVKLDQCLEASRIMQILLQTENQLNKATCALALELAVRTKNKQLFNSLSGILMNKTEKRPKNVLLDKFKHCDIDDPTIQLWLSRGFVQFNQSEDLLFILQHASNTVPALTDSLNGAQKWKDTTLTQYIFNRFKKQYNPSNKLNRGFLNRALRSPGLREDVNFYISHLDPANNLKESE